MKNKARKTSRVSKRALAVLLATVLAATAMLPMFAFAENTTEDFENLDAAISAYEDKMDNDVMPGLAKGTVYTGLSAAYDAYVRACALSTSHEVNGSYDWGEDTDDEVEGDGIVDSDLDAGAEADALTTATANIKVWQPATFTEDVYWGATNATNKVAATFTTPGSSTITSGSKAYSNVVYAGNTYSLCSGVGNIYRMTVQVGALDTVVMVYDGITTPSEPVVFSNVYYNNNNSQWIDAVFPQENQNAQLQQNWMGVKTSADSFGQYDDLPGYDEFGYAADKTKKTTYTQNNSSVRYWWNRLYYTGTGDNEKYYSLYGNDIKFSVAGGSNASSGTNVCNNDLKTVSTKTNYIINYKAVIDTASELAKKIATAMQTKGTVSNTTGIEGWTEGGLKELMYAIDGITTDESLDPNSYEYADDVEYAVEKCASNIKTAVETYGSATAGHHDDEATDEELAALKQAMEDYETKMAEVAESMANGTGYTGLADAYEAYLNASAMYTAATSVANNRMLDVVDATKALTEATAAITVAYTLTFDGKVLHEDNDATDGYNNVIWSDGTTNWYGNNGNSYKDLGFETAKIFTPNQVVYAYTGENSVYGPVGLETIVDSTWYGSGVSGNIYSLSTTNNTSNFELQHNWIGWTDSASDTSADKMYTHWVGDTIKWDDSTTWQDQIYYKSDSTSYQTDNQTNHEHSRFWWNRLYYTGDFSDGSYYDVMQNMQFRMDATDNASDPTITSQETWYVINYESIADTVEMTKEAGEAIQQYGISSFLENGLGDVFESIDAAADSSTDPSGYNFDTSVEAAVKDLADAVEAASKGVIKDASVSQDGTAYSDLVDIFHMADESDTSDKDSDVISQITQGNDGNYKYGYEEGTTRYTTKSWNAFVDAYYKALIYLYDLPETGYSDSATVAAVVNALQIAYDNLVLEKSIIIEDFAYNTFTYAGDMQASIEEEFDGTTKSDVYVTNSTTATNGQAGYSVYVRAAIEISWIEEITVDENGERQDDYHEGDTQGALDDEEEEHYRTIVDEPIENEDYTMELNLNTPDSNGGYWFYCESDGYYYYSIPLEADCSTGNLINSVTQVRDTTDPEDELYDCHLSVQIITQQIQSAGENDSTNAAFVADEWGVTINSEDGSISKD